MMMRIGKMAMIGEIMIRLSVNGIKESKMALTFS